MKQSVSAVFVCGDEIFIIERQDYLGAFPGYHSFPGGKVDKEDKRGHLEVAYLKEHPRDHMQALVRELDEELGVNLVKLIKEGSVIDFCSLGVATTPPFNPMRFENTFYKVVLKKKVDFKVDEGEAKKAYWTSAKKLLEEFKQNKILAVPPTISLISALAQNIQTQGPLDLDVHYDPEKEVALIEVLYGVKQLLPLSNTFPPANRTNCFVIGDYLIDPSPRDEDEMEKLKRALKKTSFKEIFLTHHHPDHHEFAPELARFYKMNMKMSKDTHERIIALWGEDYFKGIKVSHVKEGDILTTHLNQKVKVFEVPGHDEGQLALAPENLSWFLASDLFQTVGTVSINPPEGDMKKYFASLERVIEMNPRFLIPSHGMMVGGTYRLDQTLKHRRMREKQIRKLHEEGKKPEEILKEIYSELDELHQTYALKTIHAHLKKIEQES